MCKKINRWINNKLKEGIKVFYAKRNYILILDHVYTNRKPEDLYINHSLVIIDAVNKKLKSEKQVEIGENDLHVLINSGYLMKRSQSTTYCITENGIKFFEDYQQFLMLNTLAQFTETFKKNFSSVVVILAFITSICSLFR